MSSQTVVLASPPVAAQTKFDVTRPIAKFHPCVWGNHFLNYTPSDEEVVTERKMELESLKLEVRKELLKIADRPLESMKLIDAIERLGVSYHFEKEIEESLKQAYDAYKKNDQDSSLDLYHTSLSFRILAQHGYYVSSEIFSKFIDEHGSFIGSLKSDIMGLLSLYDAAYLRGNGDTIMEKALEFSVVHLKVVAMEKDHPLAPQICRALVYPIHKGVVLIESRHYISFYEKQPFHMRSLLRYSKLEFNVRQSLHKEELKDLTMWWRSFEFPKTFPFIRDRVVEAYLNSVSVFHDPKFSVARVVYTKAFLLLTVLDDIYDSYGTIEELEAFTKAIERWDKSTIDELPSYMKLFYEIQYDSYKQFEDDVATLGIKNYVQYAVKEVITLSKAYLQEARWCKMKYVPTFDEYFQNAIKSSATTLMVVVSLLFNYVDETDAKKTFESVSKNSKPQRATCIIGRFMDDLVDYEWDKHRDHVVGGVDCYIKQHSVSEEKAFEAINMMVENAWKEINEEIFESTTTIAKPLLPYIYNFCRIMDYVYKNENGYTIVSQRMKDTIKLVFIEPLSI
uniref:Sesquiterpene synthase 2 n=1 Tax=Persicaria minor TaxID=488003 RepID=A0A2U8JPY1_9CARY|nr:sesquiterpene synthase 2 [Persicaria minor]